MPTARVTRLAIRSDDRGALFPGSRLIQIEHIRCPGSVRRTPRRTDDEPLALPVQDEAKQIVLGRAGGTQALKISPLTVLSTKDINDSQQGPDVARATNTEGCPDCDPSNDHPHGGAEHAAVAGVLGLEVALEGPLRSGPTIRVYGAHVLR
jgi:hypothetical protein